jgi:hypothetical protein
MKAKSILVIVLTLVIGFILGMLVSAEVRYNRLKPVRMFFSEEHFREGFYKAIQPDEQQKKNIDVILDKYAKMNSELQNNFRKDLDDNMKNFRKEIDSNLSKEQIERLRQMDERRHNMSGRRMYHRNDSVNFQSDKWHMHRRAGRPIPNDSTALPGNK